MRISFSVFLLFFSHSLFAQSSDYPLAVLLQRTAQNYPSIKAKQALINAAAYNVQAARKDYLPDLIVADQYQYATANGLEGSYFSNEGTAISTSGGVHDHNIYQPLFGSFTTLMINWHAFDFGKTREYVKLAQSRLSLAQADLSNEIFQQQVKVTDAYLLFVLSQKLVAVQENNLKRAQAFEEYILSHTRSGLLPGVDSSSANAELAKAQLSLLQSRQYVLLQCNNLEQLSGVPADSIRVDTTTFLQKTPIEYAGNFSLDQHPGMIYSRQLLQSQTQQLSVIKKSVLPTINVLGMGWARSSGVDRSTKAYSSSPADGLPYQTYNYMAALALKWNITSLAKNKQQYLSAAQEVEASRFRIEEQASRLTTSIKNADLQYQSALEQTKVAPVQYKAALDAYNLSNARYKAGLASLNDVMQAYYVLNRADVDQAVSINNLWRAVLQHAAATGNFTEFTTQIPQ